MDALVDVLVDVPVDELVDVLTAGDEGGTAVDTAVLSLQMATVVWAAGRWGGRAAESAPVGRRAGNQGETKQD
ncbi:hypothetical protein ACIBCA_18015 [Kitasatospora sp. NPDC051170]|uniref:hypothetical protein n=1 Tax=Kitasatospora sp. NPDC051170 TaxID=3364056 RepID=UPI0037B7B2A1